jgi:hypothetical protein
MTMQQQGTRARAMPCDPWPTIELCPRPVHLRASTPSATVVYNPIFSDAFSPAFTGVPASTAVPPVVENPEWLRMVAAASQILWAASGRRFGTCRTHERPVCQPCGCSCNSCACDPTDALHGLEYVKLSKRPVTAVHRVTIDGVDQRLDQFGVANWKYLIRLDDQLWPDCNDLTVPPFVAPTPGSVVGEWEYPSAGTFAIEYSHGKEVPYLGRLAVAELAVELGKACVGDTDCQLPRRVQTITRKGMSMTLIDKMEHLNKGLWGLTLVDQFITSTNPNRLVRAARIFRADVPICDRPIPPRMAPDHRVTPPQEQIFGNGTPVLGQVGSRSDGLQPQPGDLYLDVTDPQRPVYELLGVRSFVASESLPFRSDEMVFDDGGDQQVGPSPAVHPRRPGDGFYDRDDPQGAVYEWRST